MAINKVKFGNQTLIDLTDTTATADKILTGFGAYGKDGVWMDGSLVPGADDGYVYQDQDNYVVLDDDEGVGVGVTPLTVTENGTYNAGTRRAYNPVTVDVQPTLQSKSVTPTESQQTVTPDSGKDGLSQVVVAGIDAGYVGSSVPRKSSSDLTATSWRYSSNTTYDYISPTISMPAGYYSTSANMGFTKILTDITGLPRQSAVTITPTEARQTAAQSRRWLTGNITVAGISSTYVGSGVPTKSSADLIRNGATITVPAGYYSGQASKSVASMTLPTGTQNGSVGTFKATIGGPESTTRYLNIPVGYHTASEYYTVASVPFMSLPTSASTSPTGMMKSTVTANTTNQYINIPSGYNENSAYYTIRGDSDLIPENIKSGVTIFGVEGTAQSEPNLRTAEVTPTEETQVIIGDLDTEVLVANSANTYLTVYYSAGSQEELIRRISLGTGDFDSTTVFPIKYRFQFAISMYKGSSSGPYIYRTIKINTVVTFTELGKATDTIGEIDIDDTIINKLVITRGGLVNSFTIFVVFNDSISETFSYAKVDPASTMQPLRVYRIDTTEYDGLSQVTVNPIPSNYLIPFGVSTISKNGTYNVRSFSSARVLVTEMPALATIVSGGTTTTEGYVKYDGTNYYRTNRSFYFNKGDSVLLHAPQRGQDQGYYGDIYIDDSFVRNAVYSYTTPSSIMAMNIQKSGNDMYVNTIYDEAVADTYATQMITRTFTSDPFIIPDNITKIGSHAFYNASSLSQVYGPYITSIGSSAFHNNRGLYNVSFPRLTNMDGFAFSYCQNLLSFDAPFLSTVGSYAFASCYRLQTVSMPEARTIGSYAFQSCSSLAAAIFPSVSTVYQYAFTSCSNLSSISFPICSSIGMGAFACCYNIARVANEEFPALTSLGNYRFRSCSKLTNVNLSRIAFVGAYTFGNCSSLTTVNMPSLTSIGTSAFYSCWELVDISFPLVSQISSAAFRSCTKLSTLVLPVINKISGSTFWGCSNLLSLYLLNTSSVVNLVATNAFGGTPISDYTTSTGGVYGSIFVPANLYNSYITSTNWSVYSSRFVSLTDAQISAILNS